MEETKDFKTIKNIRKFLEFDNRNDLANLLKYSWGQVVSNGAFGHYSYSYISSYDIYSPIEQHFLLRSLNEEDRKIILSSVLEFYPHKDHAPEITSICFNVDNDLKIDEVEYNCISTAKESLEKEKKITFAPAVFNITKSTIKTNIAVMMPFDSSFNNVYKIIQSTCLELGLTCLRADEVWKNTTIIQDIVDLISSSSIIISDFTTKNPNVMYETGIAHTLGKEVIPLTQSIDHVPFDLRHHRVLEYLNNEQGLEELKIKLKSKLSSFSFLDEIPF